MTTSIAAPAADDLLEMTPVQLDALFQDRPAGPIPRGDSSGTIIFLPGTRLAAPVNRVLGRLAWRGKVFRPESRDLKNKVTPLGLQAIRRRSTRPAAGSTTGRASSSTTRAAPRSRAGFATRSGRWRPASASGSSGASGGSSKAAS